MKIEFAHWPMRLFWKSATLKSRKPRKYNPATLRNDPTKNHEFISRFSTSLGSLLGYLPLLKNGAM
jgi:hypothetical protein